MSKKTKQPGRGVSVVPRTQAPSVPYSEEIAARICDELATGKSVRQICRQEGFPDQCTVFRWLANPEHENFLKLYTIAREAGARVWADEIIEIADDSSEDWKEITDGSGNKRAVCDHENIQRSRLKVDARKWILSKLMPKLYGDRLAVDHGAQDTLDALLKDIDGSRFRPGS